ncbi:hypothetical protein F5Y12DRAFT_794136 [Xylaria sp. FL1777]|nr:hypothetical protein F5Y12DRAFT_794136 [Xylaria sp. FL1777]
MQASLCVGSPRGIRLVTPSISSKAPSTEGITEDPYNCSQYSSNRGPNDVIAGNSSHYPHHSIHDEIDEEASNQSSLPVAPVLQPDQKPNYSVVSAISILSSVISFFNVAKQGSSRADKARVHEAMNLIRSLSTTRPTYVKNTTRTLTLRQYEELLKLIQQSEDDTLFPNQLRFEYTRSTRQFEIRRTTNLHKGLVDVFIKKFVLWRAKLEESNDPRISDAAQTLRSHGKQHVEFPVPEGARDMKSPDGGIKHDCDLACREPAIVFEVGWTSKSIKELKKRAEAYIVRSGGKVRTVVVIYMGEMVAAECKNERRLKKLCRAGQTNEIGDYSYPDNEKNKTGGASILVWRAQFRQNHRVTVGRVNEKKFRDTKGNAIQSTSLRLSLEDCVCNSMVDSVKESGATPFEISSEAFCDAIQRDLRSYRLGRAEEIRETGK